jgi:hypothetical protein
VSRATARRYRKASKRGKGQILSEFCALSGYNRCYAALLLRHWGKKRLVNRGGASLQLQPARGLRVERRGRPRLYSRGVQRALKGLWEQFDYLCGKRLQPLLRSALPLMRSQGELQLKEEVFQALLRISASSIDRMLHEEKARMQLKGRSYTRPAALLLQQQVPVRMWSQWEQVQEPGQVQMDLVGHDGGSSSGQFAFTLTLTDCYSQWTERRAVQNRAQRWVFAALQDIQAQLPFPLRSINTDSGGEFINRNLIRYCQAHQIAFTRSRPLRKNDNCFVEQKNYDAVRKIVGYLRYDSQLELSLLNQIYRLHGLLLNYLYPSQRLVDKQRQGSRLLKHHDRPASPYQRLLACERLAEVQKLKLRHSYLRLHPLQLSREVAQLQSQLLRIARQKACSPSSTQVASL